MSGARLLRIFGAGKDPSEQQDSGESTRATIIPSAGSSSNYLLMQEISEFLLINGLSITAINLTTAHAIFSGEDPSLARKLVERRNANMPITQEWLDQNRTVDTLEVSVKRMVSKLETSLDSFAQTTRTAKDAAESYTTRIADQVSGLSVQSDPAEMVKTLELLTREMIERGAEFADAMQRSEQETQTLRAELAKARHDADVDHLTGLPNRRAFEGLLDRHYREARAESDHLCVAFCDIDRFKRVNDTHGHDTGDRVIRAIGEALSRITDDNCHVARQGGEEFVMLFRGKAQQEAFDKLDAVRENFGARHFVNRSTEEPIGQITFSGGIANVFAYANPREALKAADEALYRAKESGRNRIELAP